MGTKTKLLEPRANGWRVVLIVFAAVLASCRSPSRDGPDAQASDVDAGSAVDAPVDVTADQQAPDTAIDVADAGPPPTSCPPDPLPKWPGIAAQQPQPVGTPMPGDDCAWPGWSSAPAPSAAEWTRVTADLGLDDVGKVDLCLVWQDVDDDGWDDLITLLQPTTPIAPRTLLIAHGKADGSLSPTLWPTTLHAAPSDCAIGDLDHDGKLELALSTSDGLTILSLAPTSPGADVTAQFGIPPLSAGRALAPLDFDSDGDMDLYFMGSFQFSGEFLCIPAANQYWNCCLPPYDEGCMKAKAGQPDVASCCDISGHIATQSLLRNDGGKFTDVSATLGFKNGYQESISPFDIDRDGALDFFGGDDFGRHGWFHREGDTYAYHTTDWGMLPYAHVMGSVVADFDLDRKLELVISDVGADTVYSATASGFADASAAWNVWPATRNTVTWAELAVDLDNDGWLDLVTTATVVAVDGMMQQAALQQPAAFMPGVHLALHNLGKSFAAQPLPWVSTVASGFDPPAIVAAGDYDHDHDLDLFVTEPGNKLSVWRNNSPAGNHWLVVRPVDAHGPVLNAMVQVWSQGHVLERWIQASTGFGAHLPAEARFGLGHVEALDVVRVWWPNGQVTEVTKPNVDGVVTLKQPGG